MIRKSVQVFIDPTGLGLEEITVKKLKGKLIKELVNRDTGEYGELAGGIKDAVVRGEYKRLQAAASRKARVSGNKVGEVIKKAIKDIEEGMPVATAGAAAPQPRRPGGGGGAPPPPDGESFDDFINGLFKDRGIKRLQTEEERRAYILRSEMEAQQAKAAPASRREVRLGVGGHKYRKEDVEVDPTTGRQFVKTGYCYSLNMASLRAAGHSMADADDPNEGAHTYTYMDSLESWNFAKSSGVIVDPNGPFRKYNTVFYLD